MPRDRRKVSSRSCPLASPHHAVIVNTGITSLRRRKPYSPQITQNHNITVHSEMKRELMMVVSWIYLIYAYNASSATSLRSYS